MIGLNMKDIRYILQIYFTDTAAQRIGRHTGICAQSMIQI